MARHAGSFLPGFGRLKEFSEGLQRVEAARAALAFGFDELRLDQDDGNGTD